MGLFLPGSDVRSEAIRGSSLARVWSRRTKVVCQGEPSIVTINRHTTEGIHNMTKLNVERMHKTEFFIAVGGIALIGFMNLFPPLSLAFPLLSLAGVMTSMMMIVNGERSLLQFGVALGFFVATAAIGALIYVGIAFQGRQVDPSSILLLIFVGFFIALLSAAGAGLLYQRKQQKTAK